MAMLLTLLRFVLIIPFSICFLVDASWAMPAALVIFIIASVTDWLDGYVARARNEVTVLGAALDPLADKMLTATAFVLLIYTNMISGPAVFGGLIIIMREILVTGMRESVALQGGSLPVTKIAKWKTAFQMAAIIGLIAVSPDSVLPANFTSLALGLFWAAVVLTFWTGADYTIRAIRYLRAVHS